MTGCCQHAAVSESNHSSYIEINQEQSYTITPEIMAIFFCNSNALQSCWPWPLHTEIICSRTEIEYKNLIIEHYAMLVSPKHNDYLQYYCLWCLYTVSINTAMRNLLLGISNCFIHPYYGLKIQDHITCQKSTNWLCSLQCMELL